MPKPKMKIRYVTTDTPTHSNQRFFHWMPRSGIDDNKTASEVATIKPKVFKVSENTTKLSVTKPKVFHEG
jgi:hypothetical protein